jgi:hypothetical protein
MSHGVPCRICDRAQQCAGDSLVPCRQRKARAAPQARLWIDMYGEQTWIHPPEECAANLRGTVFPEYATLACEKAQRMARNPFPSTVINWTGRMPATGRRGRRLVERPPLF